ncbi:MAG: SRPBCC family protein [Paludibacter sp.]
MTTTLIVIAAIAVSIIIVALLINKDLNVERSIIINKPIKDVFEYLRFMRNLDNFNVWNMADPNMQKEFRGTDGEIGFVYIWDSRTMKNVGAGEEEIVEINKNRKIEFEIRFKRPMQSTAKAAFILESVSADKTNVEWDFYSKSRFPMNIFKSVLGKMLEKDLEKSLQNLKKILEKRPVESFLKNRMF